MASGFNDLSLSSSDQVKLRLPKGFGASDAVGTVVELITNNRLGGASIYLEMFNKKGSADVVTKKTAKNFFKYIKNDLYDNTIFHRSVPGFVLQGGGFSAPLAPAVQGGSVDPIESYEAVQNQPGNSNLRGTIAMAKLSGRPDSATSQWFINLSNNSGSLDTQNEGFTVFGEVLGDGMIVVDQLASADVYNFGGAFAQLPLWELRDDGSSSLDIQPQDFIVVDSARKLKRKQQPYELVVESSDNDLVEASFGKKKKLKLNASGSQSGVAEISVSAVSLIDGTSYEESFDVVVGGSSEARELSRSSQRRRRRKDVFVGAGSLEEPFYRFFDAEGNELDDFKINVKKKYRFHRLDQAESHPFYIGDSGYNSASTGALKIKGDGSFADGITGAEVLKFQVRKSDRKAFKRDGELSFFCTSHSSMISDFAIKGQKSVPEVETIQEISAEPVINEPVSSEPVNNDLTAGYSGGYYRMAMDSLDQLPLI